MPTVVSPLFLRKLRLGCFHLSELHGPIRRVFCPCAGTLFVAVFGRLLSVPPRRSSGIRVVIDSGILPDDGPSLGTELVGFPASSVSGPVEIRFCGGVRRRSTGVEPGFFSFSARSTRDIDATAAVCPETARRHFCERRNLYRHVRQHLKGAHAPTVPAYAFLRVLMYSNAVPLYSYR